MRPVVWRTGNEARAFNLPPGASIDVTEAGDASAVIVQALTQSGYRARLVSQPDGSSNATIVTEGLTSQDAASRHWLVLQAAKHGRRNGSLILLLQPNRAASGLEGLSRTLRKEWPDVDTFAWTIQGDTQADMGAQIVRALKQGFGDGILSTSGALMVPEAGEPLEPPTAHEAVQPAVWLVTGGARGVTAACAIELARAAGGTILLAGRSAETPWTEGLAHAGDLKTLRGSLVEHSRQNGARVSPAEIDRTARALLAGAEIRETLASVRAAGANAVYLPLDAGDAAAVAKTLSSAQHAYGPITGLVHGAGVLADRLAADKTEAELRRVFGPKVDGLNNILNSIDVGQLSHVGFFSSAAAFFGNRGQADYAMANALLASAGRTLAEDLPAARVKVFHWGPWAGGMVDSALASHFEAQGIPLIPVDEGARIFVNELLGGDRSQVELVVGEAWAVA
ncbi:MAG: SDR family NAD(P)-dependent oxidoreductase [Hyphomonas sp.]|uniref:SDR family NAD(P)-dependent oxidoreductase n=1 Tax=Hyphomonas sp. TaxID=87 RepID=UPI0017A89C73|nr:SDR family NAD(P)-dependent oxidoreductase [Hyphomonas sp.]MBA3069727.1 SDR family NAD(P)-dependent oxidoreductase [Hyphomonas sp.]MBU3921523.1 SDR family NAD(P)-dependent oxidoreductase [Alphaproteobacteria bacterium]MBU4062568.1 SDR family NAD(P)-dependent oxidoreductase [Alphaproteobacteria bacterium]MBU4163919.1 SDR family NAD(P)-dependent oxidoreductase [Alphaproteobacteria bacterium]